MHNVHSLIHFGPLDNVSAFPFESYLYQLKKMVRKLHEILPHILNRLRARKGVGRKNRISVCGIKKECCTNPSFTGFRGHKSYFEVYSDENFIKAKTGDNIVSAYMVMWPR